MPAGFEEGMFDVQIARLPPATLPALVNELGRVLLPLAPMLRLTGTPEERSPGGDQIAVSRPRGAGTNVLDVAAGLIRAGDSAWAVAPGEVVQGGGELFVSAERIADLLEADVQVDWERLGVQVSRDAPFPAQRQAMLDARRTTNLAHAAGEGAPSTVSVPYAAKTGGLVAEWGVSSSGWDSGEQTSLRGRVGTAVLGGQLAVGGITTRDPLGSDGVEWTASYHRALPEQRWLRQIRAGDLLTDGLQARSIRGVSITNAPYVRDALFAQVPVAPDLPEGWQYEVYQSGQLLGFSEGLEAGPVSVPLRYGSTPVQVRMYGPAGQEIVSELLYQIPVLQLREREWQYAAGAGVCPRQQCDGIAYGDLRHGITRWLTVGGGTETMRDTAAAHTRAYGVASVAPGTGWMAEVSAMPSEFVNGRFQYFGDGRVSASVSGGVADPGSGQLSWVPTTVRRWHAESAVGAQIPGGLGPLRSVRLRGHAEGPTGGGVDRWRGSAFASVHRGFVEATYEAGRWEPEGLLSVRATRILPRQGPEWLHDAPVSVGVGIAPSGVQMLEASAFFRVQTHSELNVATRWNAYTRQPTLGVGLSATLDFARVNSRIATSSRGQPGGNVSAEGGLAYGRDTGLQAFGRGGTGSAGVSGRVFFDHDADGRFGPGDKPVPEIGVMIGGQRSTSDARGFYESWAILPYEIVRISVDTLKLPDPSWVPREHEILTRPTPHRFNPVDIPLVQTREVSGRIVGEDGVRSVGGISVEIVNRATGAIQRTVTFSDGEYYISRVLPGRYELRVADSSLRALGAEAQGGLLSLDVPPDPNGLLMEAGSLLLRPAQPLPGQIGGGGDALN